MAQLRFQSARATQINPQTASDRRGTTISASTRLGEGGGGRGDRADHEEAGVALERVEKNRDLLIRARYLLQKEAEHPTNDAQAPSEAGILSVAVVTGMKNGVRFARYGIEVVRAQLAGQALPLPLAAATDSG